MGSHHICTASSPAILSSLSTDDCALANSNYIAPPIKVVRPAKSVSQTKHMEVPMFVGNEKRDLAKFAAQVWSSSLAFELEWRLTILEKQINCLFWFETTAKLKAIENNQDSTHILTSRVSPTLDFQNWVAMLLSKTQVSYNIILLGLMFIYQLKKLNCAVKGKSGSEFRVLTIALILGSKSER